MTGPRILSIGDIDLDIMVAVPTLPAYDGKVAGRRLGTFPGGMAANVAVALQHQGAQAHMLGVVGDDSEGEHALGALRADYVDTSRCLVRPDTATFTCFVLLTQLGEKALVRLETPAFMPCAQDVAAAALSGIEHVHINYGNAAMAAEAVARAKGAGATVSLDLEAADFRTGERGALADLLPRLDVLFVNATAGEQLPPPPGAAAGRPGVIVTTRGKAGASLDDGAATVESPGFAVTPLDTTGAGDCFAAGFLVAHLAGVAPEEALARANAAAALSTQAYGAQTAAPSQGQVAVFRQAIAAGATPDTACQRAREEAA